MGYDNFKISIKSYFILTTSTTVNEDDDQNKCDFQLAYNYNL